MNDHAWVQLIQNTVFLSPAIVERFAAEHGDALVMPVTFRGSRRDWGVPDNGYPVLDDGRWYSLWGMRPSRDTCSLALGLRRRDLEENARRAIACTNGSMVEREWRVHHVYECGSSDCSVADRAGYFTNLANLVLVSKEYHEGQSSFIHGAGLGAQWLRWVIAALYPKASCGLGLALARPAGSPGIEDVNVAIDKSVAHEALRSVREQEPAGSDIATRRWKEAQAGISTSAMPATKAVRKPRVRRIPERATKEMAGWMSAEEITAELNQCGFLARQNSQGASLYLNLGGKSSTLNRDDFRGAILFYPSECLMLGISPEEVLAFRELVMKQIGEREWVRKEGVPGPATGPNRVAVDLVVSETEESGMVCRVNGDDIRFDGYAEAVEFHDGRCEWSKVAAFLANFDRFCRQVS